MRRVEEAVARHAPARRHRLARGAEGLSHDRNGRYAGPLEEDRVEHTARRARPSVADSRDDEVALLSQRLDRGLVDLVARRALAHHAGDRHAVTPAQAIGEPPQQDRKSTRLNSSHLGISYAVYCLKKK